MMKRMVSRVLSGLWVAGVILASSVAVAQTNPIQTFTLPSGQHVYVKEDHTKPIVTIDTWVKTGSVHETAANNGVSHFLEHLLFKGTDELPVGAFERILESKGGQFNAATSDDYTHYYITIASPFFEDALKLHANMLTRSTIPPAELERERKVVQEEINRATDNPDHKRFQAASQLLYGQHPYALDTLGPKSLIGSIPREKILTYYRQWYQPTQFNTVISGDVSATEATALVQKYFGASSSRKFKATVPVGEPKGIQHPQVKVLEDPNVSQDYVTFAFLGPSVAKAQDSYALDVAMMTLGAGKSSRLHQALYEKNPLVTEVGAGNMTQKYAGVLYVDAQMKPENREKVKTEIIQHLQALKANGITAAELEKAKTQVIKDFIYHNESTDDVASRVGYYVTISNLSEYTDYVQRIQQLTLADVQQAAQKYLDFNQAVLVELLPAGSANLAQEEAASLNLLANAAKAPSLASKMPSPEDSVTDTQRGVLANGMTLITKPVKGSQTVAVKVFVRGGELVEPIPGMAPLVAAVLTQGTPSRTASQMSEELESRGLQFTVSSHDDYFEVTGVSVKEDLGELFLLMGDALVNPLFEEKEVQNAKKHLAESIQASRDNPSSIVFENLSTAIYPFYPYGDVGKRIEPHLKLIQRQDLVNFYRQSFVPNNMVVSVVGNFDEESLKHYLLNAFPASLNQRGQGPVVFSKIANAAPLKETQTLEEKKPIQGATWIAQGWQAPSVESEDHVPLKVLNSLLGGGMSSRLFSNIREKQGLAYVVSSMYPSTAKTGQFTLYLGTDPKNKEQVLTGFNREITRLQQEPISAQELQEAKDKLAGAFALAHDTNEKQAFYLGFYETLGMNGLGYQYDEQYAQKIQQVTAQDIQRVAQKYFSQPHVTTLVVPQDKPSVPLSTKP